MRGKIIAALAGTALFGLAAVGAFASQDAILDEEETPTATQSAATETPEAVATPDQEQESTHEGDGEKRDVAGIPDDNPNFEPDGGGECERGESAIKETPSANDVMVPCHAAEHENDGQHGEGDVEDDADQPDEGDDAGEEHEDLDDEDELPDGTDNREDDGEHEDEQEHDEEATG